MMTADAVVRDTHADGSVDLEFAQAKGCAGCAGVCLWRLMQPTIIRRVSIPSQARAVPAPGSAVVMSLPDRAVLRGSLLLHGLPLAAILSGGWIGAVLTQSDWGCLAGALIATTIAWRVAPRIRTRIEQVTLAELGLKLI